MKTSATKDQREYFLGFLTLRCNELSIAVNFQLVDDVSPTIFTVTSVFSLVFIYPLLLLLVIKCLLAALTYLNVLVIH